MPAFFARISLLVALIGLACLLTPSAASAWTRTEVRGMRARAEIMPSGFARIGLEITVEVEGGWVERFEIAGLGQGAKLDVLKPPTWLKSSVALDDTDAVPGTKYVPSSKLRDDGLLTLDFGTRHGAPKRGTFQSRIVYETQLQRDARGALVVALPTWPSALENVELWIDAPRGSELLPASDGELDSVQVLARGALTTVHIARPQLPRTHPLEARLVLPGVEAAATVELPAAIAAAEEGPERQAVWLSALLLMLIALKRSTGRVRAAARGERAFSAAKAIAIALPCAVFPFALAWSPTAGTLVLAVAATLGACLPTSLHGEALPEGLCYRRAHAIDLQRARRERLLGWLGPRSWVDATTPSGLALLGMLGALAWLAIERTPSSTGGDALWLTTWAAALPLFVLRTRLHVRHGAGDALFALAAAQGTLAGIAREHGTSARLEVARLAVCDSAQHARLCFGDALSLVLARDGAGRSTLAWLITREGRTVLRGASDPSTELRAFLEPAQLAQSEVLANAA